MDKLREGAKVKHKVYGWTGIVQRDDPAYPASRFGQRTVKYDDKVGDFRICNLIEIS